MHRSAYSEHLELCQRANRSALGASFAGSCRVIVAWGTKFRRQTCLHTATNCVPNFIVKHGSIHARPKPNHAACCSSVRIRNADSQHAACSPKEVPKYLRSGASGKDSGVRGGSTEVPKFGTQRVKFGTWFQTLELVWTPGPAGGGKHRENQG